MVQKIIYSILWSNLLFQIVAYNLDFGFIGGFSDLDKKVTEGGDPVTVTFGCLRDWQEISDLVNCTIQSPEGSRRKLDVSPKIVTLRKTDCQRTIEISAPFDCSYQESEYTGLVGMCRGNYDITSQTLTNIVRIHVEDTTTPAMCRDPHIVQSVKGMNENQELTTELLCYDFFGQPGKGYELVSDDKLGISVITYLRDDYYIGRVTVRTNSSEVSISSFSINGPDFFTKSWNEKFVKVFKFDNNLNIVVRSRLGLTVKINGNNRKLKLNIAKIAQNFGKSYLDVNVYETNDKNVSFDEHHNGLLALVYKNNYKFYEAVQNDGKSAIYVNDILHSVHKKSSGRKKCFSININSLLFPKTVDAIKVN